MFVTVVSVTLVSVTLVSVTLVSVTLVSVTLVSVTLVLVRWDRSSGCLFPFHDTNPFDRPLTCYRDSTVQNVSNLQTSDLHLVLAVGTLHGFPHENYQSSIRELTPSPTVPSEVSASRSRRLEKKRNETKRRSKRSETNERASGPLTSVFLKAQTNKQNNGRNRRSSK